MRPFILFPTLYPHGGKTKWPYIALLLFNIYGSTPSAVPYAFTFLAYRSQIRGETMGGSPLYVPFPIGYRKCRIYPQGFLHGGKTKWHLRGKFPSGIPFSICKPHSTSLSLPRCPTPSEITLYQYAIRFARWLTAWLVNLAAEAGSTLSYVTCHQGYMFSSSSGLKVS